MIESLSGNCPVTKRLQEKIQSLEKQNKLLKECLISIHNVDGMQLDEKDYCFKKESIEVHRLIENTLEQINKMESENAK